MTNYEYVGFIIAKTEDTVVVMMPASLNTDIENTHHQVNTLSNTNSYSVFAILKKYLNTIKLIKNSYFIYTREMFIKM
jgi:hypothetical protein